MSARGSASARAASPRAAPGQRSLVRTSRVSSQHLPRAAGGGGRVLTQPIDASDPTTPSGVSRDCCETRAIAPARRTRPRTTTRAPNRRPPPFPSMMLFRSAAQHTQAETHSGRRASGDRHPRRPRRVERLVGARGERVAVGAVGRARRQPDRDGQRRAAQRGHGGDGVGEPLGQRAGAGGAEVGGDDPQAPVVLAAQDVAGAQLAADGLLDARERLGGGLARRRPRAAARRRPRPRAARTGARRRPGARRPPCQSPRASRTRKLATRRRPRRSGRGGPATPGAAAAHRRAGPARAGRRRGAERRGRDRVAHEGQALGQRRGGRRVERRHGHRQRLPQRGAQRRDRGDGRRRPARARQRTGARRQRRRGRRRAPAGAARRRSPPRAGPPRTARARRARGRASAAPGRRCSGRAATSASSQPLAGAWPSASAAGGTSATGCGRRAPNGASGIATLDTSRGRRQR